MQSLYLKAEFKAFCSEEVIIITESVLSYLNIALEFKSQKNTEAKCASGK